MQTTPDVPLKEDYLPFLDGLRGLAAVWVMVSHAQLLAGRKFAVLDRGDVAVDLFMIMSGFLMAYHYYVRQEKEPWEESRTWIKFYIRRFFRIAPLYYILFFIYLAIGPAIGQSRHEIGLHHYTAITPVERYSDRSWTNILMHLSFLFGISPTYSFRTPMPDWSIGLEMQFYLVFPLLMLLFRKERFVVSTAVLCAGCYFINRLWIKHAFSMPSFLTLSLLFFLIGMLLATYNRYKTERSTAALAVGTAFLLAFLSREPLIVLITIVITVLLSPYLQGNPLRRFMYGALGNRFTGWLADMLYSVYLLHLAFMTPIAWLLLRSHAVERMQGGVRFLIIFVLTALPTYLVAMLLFHLVEKNGILLGKRLVRKL